MSAVVLYPSPQHCRYPKHTPHAETSRAVDQRKLEARAQAQPVRVPHGAPGLAPPVRGPQVRDGPGGVRRDRPVLVLVVRVHRGAAEAGAERRAAVAGATVRALRAADAGLGAAGRRPVRARAAGTGRADGPAGVRQAPGAVKGHQGQGCAYQRGGGGSGGPPPQAKPGAPEPNFPNERHSVGP